MKSYGGKSLHNGSHGESFFALIMNKFGKNGLYILDEPEAPLSPIRQMSLISRMDELVKGGQPVYNCDAFADFDGVSEEFYI
ncbi:hypothetical protein [Intestinibacter bartlettii]|uniref:hypothetical protein n=1 Tax=Intestinibacter bartlettii TaxID=261299 RepID=UPI00321A83F6